MTALVTCLLYAASLALYLRPLASPVGLLAAVLAGALALPLAARAHRARLRLPWALLLALAVGGAGLLLGELARETRLLPRLLGIGPGFALAEGLTLGLGALALVFLLRFLSHTARALSLLEVLFVVGSTVVTFLDHRGRMLSRPRFFSDWAWSMGVDPGTVLLAVGILAAVGAVFLFLRGPGLLKLLSTLLLLLLLGSLFFLVKEKRIERQAPPDALGLSGKQERRGGRGQGQSPFADDYSESSPPNPVAIAILRDDYAPPTPILYFRQTVLSRYNGHHLVSATDGSWDADVLTEFPRGPELRARETQSPAEHLTVPTTMYLLTDHPQPPALSHAVKLRPAPNPSPQQFVAAYEVESRALAVPAARLLGRHSVPPGWPRATREHYLAFPADPRYRALADIVAREVDPRFAGDDLARAFAIKRYLEREGFYTRKSTHTSASDPTASFLFGSLRGYCVHFAHAAVYLLRSQGIAARVAMGYAVQTAKRSGGSSILILGDRAHAWPEIHLEGIGWVTFDVYPERTDLPPPAPVDYDLEKLLGELARGDRTAGFAPEGHPLRLPWRTLGLLALCLAGGLLLLAYAVKTGRRLAPALAGERAYPRRLYRAVLDRLADLGAPRLPGETRERHAARLAPLTPTLEELTRRHLAQALGGRASSRQELAALAAAVRADLRRHLPRWRRALGWLHPLGWLRTR